MHENFIVNNCEYRKEKRREEEVQLRLISLTVMIVANFIACFKIQFPVFYLLNL